MRLSLLTPTCDQPVGFARCEVYMQRQWVPPGVDIEWIVVDDGVTPITPTQGQIYIRRQRGDVSSAESFCDNLQAGLDAVTGDYLIFIEHDDWYAPRHLLALWQQLGAPGVLIAGDPLQRYYSLSQRTWKTFDNVGASLCQTGVRAETAVPLLEVQLARYRATKRIGLDRALWEAIPRPHWALARTDTVVGLKGLPGRQGLGVGHQAARTARWTPDPDGTQLAAWIGTEDAAWYRGREDSVHGHLPRADR